MLYLYISTTKSGSIASRRLDEAGINTQAHMHTHREQNKNPRLQACFIFQLVTDHGNLTLSTLRRVWCLVQVTYGWLGASLTC